MLSSDKQKNNSHPSTPPSTGEPLENPTEPCPGRLTDDKENAMEGSTAGHVARDAYHKAARQWFKFGLQVIPVVPETKQPALEWDDWLDSLSPATIDRHWQQCPEHQVGFIVGDGLIVFDADGPEAITAFNLLMESLDISCNHIVSTSKGEHYYFKLEPGTFAKIDGFDSNTCPDCLDIRTGRGLIVLPPSTGKSVSMSEAETVDDFMEVGQDFVDAIFRHNGREVPRPHVPHLYTPVDPANQCVLSQEIPPLLRHIDPDCGYDDWVTVLMAVHYEFSGDIAGLELVDEWSGKGSKYRGRQELEKKWHSFDGYSRDPVTLGSICKLAADGGADLDSLFEEQFEAVDDIRDDAGVVARDMAKQGKETESKPSAKQKEEHCLLKFSLRGMSGKFERDMREQVSILGDLALQGQLTVIYAPPNSGKTLIGLSELIEGIKAGKINPEHLFYVNADDNLPGLTAKLKLAEQHGFHMLAPGHRDFRAKDFLDYLRSLCRNGQAMDTIVVLDTLKKFADLMDKRNSSEFNNVAREFISNGGTLIELAHVNKKRDPDGKPIYAGTSDMVDDADCVYVMDTLGEENDVRTVVFENIKSRGLVARKATYQYNIAEGLTYPELLESVSRVDDSKAEALRQTKALAVHADAPLIEAITDAINDGHTAKTVLIKEAASITGVSKRATEKVLEKYRGTDPELHYWKFSTRERGAKIFELLSPPEEASDSEEQ